MLLVICAAASVLFLIASYHDIRHRSIPNALPLAVTGAAALKWAAIGQLEPALWAVGVAAIVLVVTALCFRQGWIGGGDVKLMAAAVLFLGAPATVQFLLLMAVIGGIMAVVLLVLRRRVAPRPTIPYGVAIAAAAIVMMALDRSGLWTA